MASAVDTAVLGCYTVSMNNNDDIDLSMDSLTPVTYKFSNSGTANTVLSVGTNGIDWSSLPYTINTSATNTWNTNNNITLNGDGADIRVNGKSLGGAIDAIERRLAILHPNPEIEKEWEELRQLGDRYRELEKEIQAKMQVWDVLKKTDI